MTDFEAFDEYFATYTSEVDDSESNMIEFKYDYDEPQFYIVWVECLLEVTSICIFIYCFFRSLSITTEEHKTSQYKKYQWLRILLILFCICFIFRDTDSLLLFPQQLYALEQAIECIGTFSDTLYAISVVIALWQIAILCNR